MPTTSNFGWTTPADTDLVKDGAAAIRTLGNGIDTSFLDLKGGTTGQNLRKASNTDLDFTFAGDATNTVVDAAGDLLYGTANDTLGRLAIGTAGQVLKVNSGATAPEWGAVTDTNGFKKLASATFSAVSSVSLANDTFSSTYRNYRVDINIDTNASSPSGIFLRMRASGSDKTGASYYSGLYKIPYTGSPAMTWQTTGGTSSQIFDSFKDGFISLDVANPFTSTERTSIKVDTVEGELVYRAAGIVTFLSDDSCDALTFYMTSGNMTGRYAVYGYEI